MTFLLKGGSNPSYFMETYTDEFNTGFHDGTNWRETLTGINLSINTWYHLAGVFDDTNNTYKVYINGAEVLSDTGFTWTPQAGTGTLHLGSTGSSQYFDGQLDDVRLYNRALSAAEIQALAAQ